MSDLAKITERQLRLGVLKIALSLVVLLSLVALGLTLLAGHGQNVAVSLLLSCLAFGFLANGIFAVLKIIDWFEARKRRHG